MVITVTSPSQLQELYHRFNLNGNAFKEDISGYYMGAYVWKVGDELSHHSEGIREVMDELGVKP